MDLTTAVPLAAASRQLLEVRLGPALMRHLGAFLLEGGRRGDGGEIGDDKQQQQKGKKEKKRRASAAAGRAEEEEGRKGGPLPEEAVKPPGSSAELALTLQLYAGVVR